MYYQAYHIKKNFKAGQSCTDKPVQDFYINDYNKRMSKIEDNLDAEKLEMLQDLVW